MDSDSSSLSDPPLTEDESLSEPSKPTLKLLNGKLASFMRKNVSPLSSPEPDQADLGREPSPPHEYTLADNPDISVSLSRVMRVENDAFCPGFSLTSDLIDHCHVALPFTSIECFRIADFMGGFVPVLMEHFLKPYPTSARRTLRQVWYLQSQAKA